MDEDNISRSQRGGEVFLHEGHEYLRRTPAQWMSPDKKYWRCRKYKSQSCKAMLVTQGERIVSGPSEHSHSGDPVQVAVVRARTTIVNRAEGGLETPRLILGEQLTVMSDDALARMPRKSSLERQVRRKRQKMDNVHPVPHDRNFELPQEYQDLVLADTGPNDENRIIVLGSQELVGYLRGEVWAADGTFSTTPAIFFQLYTIHAKVGDQYPPCVYFLLPNKTADTYRRMLQIMHDIIPEADPVKILLDFERGAMNAFSERFPNAIVSGCFFHLSQSVIRKVSELGLKTTYETDEEFSMLVRSLPALAFVPEEEVEERFEEVAAAFPDEPAVNNLISYFESTYVRGPRLAGRYRDPTFPPGVWSHFADAVLLEPKTTNACEGFHNALKSLFMCTHPSVWKFLNGIRKDIAIQRLLHIRAEQMQGEGRRKKWVELARRLRAKVELYFEEPDKLRYLRAIAHMQVAR